MCSVEEKKRQINEGVGRRIKGLSSSAICEKMRRYDVSSLDNPKRKKTTLLCDDTAAVSAVLFCVASREQPKRAAANSRRVEDKGGTRAKNPEVLRQHDCGDAAVDAADAKFPRRSVPDKEPTVGKRGFAVENSSAFLGDVYPCPVLATIIRHGEQPLFEQLFCIGAQETGLERLRGGGCEKLIINRTETSPFVTHRQGLIASSWDVKNYAPTDDAVPFADGKQKQR
ncbi:hypothetical protein G5I_04299 [Acromyrmex echinatior]|uniref:Uncharacterized protein n=1 Tax=Acromyrmex echinatior TaxID=103372 RepID=F4WF92_ACREC|nr:hypothetical protein G5I_04299 [Acromyrmex echinatior]